MTRIVMTLAVIVACSGAAYASDLNGDHAEMVLLPLAFSPLGDEVPGAFGTVWTGSVWMHNRNVEEVFLDQCFGVVCVGFRPDRMGLVHSPIGDHPEVGYLLYPSALHAEKLTFSNRIFERTRHGQPRGVNIPVAREGEFFVGQRTLLGVPVGSGVRAGIRVYDPWIHEVLARPSPALTSVRIEVLNEEQVVLGSATVTPTITFKENALDRSRPGFAAIHDLAVLAPQIGNLQVVHVRVTPVPTDAQYYAMVAVTDNDTQTVSIITADK